MKMQIKTFLLGKDGEENGRQDVLRFNTEKGLYAVADGVSNSFHPEIVARILCEKFVSMNPEDVKDWGELPNIALLPGIKDLWQTQVDEYMSSLSGRLLRHEQYNYETWEIGASTFCGIHYDEKNYLIRFAILGDSTLFLHLKDGQIKSLNSSKKQIDENGVELTDYSNSTDAILSNGTFVGEWLIGEVSVSDICSISIMTDGMAKWFQKSEIKGLLPEQALWGLQTNEMFKTLADTARKEGDMDDDLAVILIKIESVESQSESKTVRFSSDNISSGLDSTDNHDKNNHDQESDKRTEQINTSNQSSPLITAGIPENSMNSMEVKTDEVEVDLKVNVPITHLQSEMQSEDTPSDNITETISEEAIDNSTCDVTTEAGQMIENNQSAVDNDFDNCDEAKMETDTKVTIEINKAFKNDRAIEEDVSGDSTEFESKFQHRSLMDKIKDTFRIWRNYPTDPTK